MSVGHSTSGGFDFQTFCFFGGCGCGMSGENYVGCGCSGDEIGG